MRRFGEPPERGRRYIRRPGAYAVIEREGWLLLTEQSGESVELQLPGGGIDPGESPLRALHREVLEETGWKIRLRGRLGAWQRFTYMPEYGLWAHKIYLVYLASPTLCAGPPREAGHRALWRPGTRAVAALTNAGDRHFAARALAVTARARRGGAG